MEQQHPGRRLAFARHLVEDLGLSVIPTRGKRPAVKWARFQEAHPTPKDLEAWFGKGQAFDPGIVCGAVSRVVAVDSDDDASEAWAREHLPATPMTTKTPNGWHRFYRHPGGTIRNKARVRTGDARLKLDVRADGGFVVGPGATHPTGKRYTMPTPWPASVDELPVFNPAWLEAVVKESPLPAPSGTATSVDERVRRARAYLRNTPPAVEGQGGDEHTFGVACKVARGFDLTDAEALELLREWNDGCVPPWTDQELENKIRGARAYGEEPVGGRLLEDRRSPRVADEGRRGPSRASQARARTSLAEVEETFTKWIRDDDPIPTRAVLAAYVANRALDGDPVWLMLVGGSGVGKTERLIPLAAMPDVVLESSITGPAALLSGTGRKERAKDSTGGLLRKLPPGGGVLLLKDFTSIIDMHRDARAEVLAALREVHDGRWDRSVGAEGGRTLTWEGHLGLIAGCTTAIDSAHGVMSIMGTRFLLVRLQGDPDIAGAAFDHVGEERPMREALRAAVRGLLDHLPGEAFDKADARTQIIALASYVARARSPVKRDQRGDIELVLDPEAPTRIVKMLAQLWRAGGLLGLAPGDAWALVRRVGLDSIPKLRRAVLDHLAKQSDTLTTTQLAEAVEHPAQTTRRALEDLTSHGVTQRTAGGQGKADRWNLAWQTRHWLGEMTFPVSSESTMSALSTSHPYKKSKITNDDKTGKVGGGGDAARF